MVKRKELTEKGKGLKSLKTIQYYEAMLVFMFPWQMVW